MKQEVKVFKTPKDEIKFFDAKNRRVYINPGKEIVVMYNFKNVIEVCVYDKNKNLKQKEIIRKSSIHDIVAQKSFIELNNETFSFSYPFTNEKDVLRIYSFLRTSIFNLRAPKIKKRQPTEDVEDKYPLVPQEDCTPGGHQSPGVNEPVIKYPDLQIQYA